MTTQTKKAQPGDTSFNSPEISSHKAHPAPSEIQLTESELPQDKTPRKYTRRQKARFRALAQNKAMAEQMSSLGEYDLANALKRCGVTKQLWICGDCGYTSYVDYSCHKRICTLCAMKTSRERAHQVELLFAGMKKPKWLTLTMTRAKNVSEGVKRIRRAFAKWRRLKAIKNRIDGGVYQIECKPKDDGWHVHLHALIDAAYLPKPLIWRTWAYALNQKSASVDIQGNLSGRKISHYISKYQTKPQDLSGQGPQRAFEFLDLLRNQRLFGTFGNCHNKLEKPDKGDPIACPHCGGNSAFLPFHLGYTIYGRDEWRQIAGAIQGDQPEFIPKLEEEETPPEKSFPAVFSDENLPF